VSTHPSWHRTRPKSQRSWLELALVEHWPPLQAPPFPHAMPQPPQLFGSAFKSTHLLPHEKRPDRQANVHTPPEHSGVAPEGAGQTLPQLPQFCGSVLVLTQLPLQSVLNGSHAAAHVPKAQICPVPQMFVQDPQ